jgi:hypothetical protein
MKTRFTALLIFFCSLAGVLHAHPQVEHLKEAYKAQGDALFIPLYWLPETRQTVLKHIPDHQNWVGFEMGLWKKLMEEEKLLVIEELGSEFERLGGAKLDTTWKRINDWQHISAQLSLLAAFLDQDEGFLDLAYGDPALRPAFKWITDRRRADFDTKHIGSTFSSGEMATFYPHLTEHLLNAAEHERPACFSRLFARIAEIKSAKADHGSGANPAKPGATP